MFRINVFIVFMLVTTVSLSEISRSQEWWWCGYDDDDDDDVDDNDNAVD